jgi:hypothetical protein
MHYAFMTSVVPMCGLWVYTKLQWIQCKICCGARHADSFRPVMKFTVGRDTPTRLLRRCCGASQARPRSRRTVTRLAESMHEALSAAAPRPLEGFQHQQLLLAVQCCQCPGVRVMLAKWCWLQRRYCQTKTTEEPASARENICICICTPVREIA